MSKLSYPFVPCNESNYRKGRTSAVKFLVIHYTGNNGDTAEGNCKYFKNTVREASAHYFVDEDSICQSVRDTDTAWHCGTRGAYYHKTCRNANSIGIELCSRKHGNTYYFLEETIERAAELARELMEKYNIPIENVVRHYDVTHKICPAPFVHDEAAWDNFKERLDDEMTQEQFNKMADAWLASLGERATPAYAREAMQFFIDKGTFKGNVKGQAMAQKPLTRAEYCVLRKREIDKGL